VTTSIRLNHGASADGFGSVRGEISAIVARLKTASTLIEGRFLEIGSALESAIATLRKLVGTSQQLVEELNRPELQSATRELEQAAMDVTALGALKGERPETLLRMMELTRAIADNISGANDALKPAAVLAINAKIEAARLGDAGAEFVDFSNRISPSLEAARVTLGQVGDEAMALGRQLQEVWERDVELGRRKDEALRHVPTRIAASVATIAARGREAARVAAAIAEQSQHISRQVAAAVMALQIGDATRQRAEHVQYALDLALDLSGPDASSALLGMCCGLQAVQLLDTADELDRDARKILGSLNGLTENAADIARIGGELYGADRGNRSFLDELNEGVAAARSLFDGLRDAREAADQVVTSASRSASQLVGRIDTIRTLEADVRDLALNAFLKCSRLGPQGRALSIIAEELRGCADRTAVETSAVASDLERALEMARELVGRREADTEVSTAEVAAIMTQAAERLSVSGLRVSASLEVLGSDSELAAQLVASTAAQIVAHEEVGRVFRQAAAVLAAIGESVPVVEAADQPAEDMLERIYQQYTMNREREIHRAFQDKFQILGFSGGRSAA
jgi:hypothetical protein